MKQHGSRASTKKKGTKSEGEKEKKPKRWGKHKRVGGQPGRVDKGEKLMEKIRRNKEANTRTLRSLMRQIWLLEH